MPTGNEDEGVSVEMLDRSTGLWDAPGHGPVEDYEFPSAAEAEAWIKENIAYRVGEDAKRSEYRIAKIRPEPYLPYRDLDRLDLERENGTQDEERERRRGRV